MEQKQINLSALSQTFESLADKNWAVSGDIFAASFCQELAHECQNLAEQGELKKASIGHGASKAVAADIRGDFTLWLDEKNSPVQRQFLQYLEQIRESMNQFFFMGLKRVESHFALYPPGTGYDKHIDNHHGLNNRKITFVLYLNEAWQKEHGGELSIYNPEKDTELLTKIEPRFGTFILFRSDLFPHQVEKSSSPRLSVTGWFRDDAL